MLHEMNQLSTKKCANLQEQCGRSSAPSPTVLNSVFLLLLASIFPSLTTNLSKSVATSSIFPNSTYYSPVILPRPLLKPWFLYSLLINIAFTFMPVFAITAIVFKGQKGMEVKLQNLGILGIRNSPEFWVLVLGFSFMNTVIVLDIIWITPRVSSFH